MSLFMFLCKLKCWDVLLAPRFHFEESFFFHGQSLVRFVSVAVAGVDPNATGRIELALFGSQG